jgi:glutaredoxin
LPKLKQISIVLADWCPHCVPVSLDMTKRMAKDLHVPYRVLDIDDPEDVEIADKLVMDHGDYAEDYLIPQVFLEHADGSTKHFFTGFSEGVDVTRRGWENLFQSRFYRDLKAKIPN